MFSVRDALVAAGQSQTSSFGLATFDDTDGFAEPLLYVASGCTVDADCDDGVFCNGAETCTAGACAPGTAPSCDDGVACTVDTCDSVTDA
ncbi:MAG: hypothetical protein GWO04_38545, partial [Actinobacteria bacterium]|nr:hypothetical protein [Actinomycetota bacterium]